MGRHSCGYIVRARPREDGALSIIEVNPAACTVLFTTGEELVIRQGKLLALAEQLAQERAAVIIRSWPHKDFCELVELYRAPSQGWQAPPRTETCF